MYMKLDIVMCDTHKWTLNGVEYTMQWSVLCGTHLVMILKRKEPHEILYRGKGKDEAKSVFDAKKATIESMA